MHDWKARFIAADDDTTGAPLLRGEAALEPGHGPVVRATLRYSALGVVEARIDGHPVSEDVLTPGWSSYEWRVRYAETDVTALVRDRFAIELALGNGWYRGRLTWTGRSALYGSELAGIAELRVVFADGAEQVVGTDTTWCAAPSATTANDLYDGQSIDARHREAVWGGVHELDDDLRRLEPYVGPPVRRQEAIEPVAIELSPSGRVLLDFGQNLVGWVRARVCGESGAVVTLRHAEVLEEGELALRPLRTAKATDRFTLSGGDDVFEPTLTFHGFRYVEVDGWPGGIDAIRRDGGLTAIVVSSELRRIGAFSSSDPLLNRLHRNAVWGMRGNFLDVPTDCPQRDERLGWTGDISAFAPSAAYLFDSADFLRDWLRDVALEQEHQDGLVPYVVPDVLKFVDRGDDFPAADSAAIWSDAAVWVPWALYTAYGDTTVLREQLASMVSHGRRVRGLLSPSGLWDTGTQFGDWLDPDAPPERPDQAKADPHVVATACAYRTADLIATIAAMLGEEPLAEEFATMAARIRDAFHLHYVGGDALVQSDCVTVYALAIGFGVLRPELMERAGARLAAHVVAAGHRIATGFAGTPFVTDALTCTGHLDDAYRLLLQTECPSWLYPVTMGATTIWERWDSMLPDGSINPGEMTSFNHYALGAVVDWMHRTVAGLAPLEPGYRRILFAPQPGGELDWAETSLDTPHGRAAIRWERDGDRMTAEVEVPTGTTAVLRLPRRADEELAPGTHTRSTDLDTRDAVA